MKRFLLLFLALPVFAAPSTPITRGRLTTDLDADGHTVTNSNLATTNFVWEVVGAVTNNLPSGGVDDGEVVTNIVYGIVAAATNGLPNEDAVWRVADARAADHASGALEAARLYTDYAISSTRTNLPPVAASATVGELVDAINAISTALRPEEP